MIRKVLIIFAVVLTFCLAEPELEPYGRDNLNDDLVNEREEKEDRTPTVAELVTMIQSAMTKLRVQLDELVKKIREPIEGAMHDVQNALEHPQETIFTLMEPKIECSGDDVSAPKDEKIVNPCSKLDKYCAIRNLVPLCLEKERVCKCVAKSN